MPKEKVRIELINHKLINKNLYLYKRTLYEAWIQEDGTAHLYRYPSTILQPDEYIIYIPEQEYDKLLAN